MSLAQGLYLLFLAMGCLTLGPGSGAPRPSATSAIRPATRIPSTAELEARTRPARRPTAGPMPTVREADISWAGPVSGPLLWPVQGGRLALRFGAMNGSVHEGVDLHGPMGAPVRAAATGKVAYVGLRPGAYGNLVVLDHEAGWQTAYAHNDVNLVRRRQRVLAGQIIARVGATGHAASTKTPTLHFEVREHGKPHNPLRFFDLPAEPDPGLNPGEIEPETVSLLLP